MLVYITSTGEATTELCEWSLKRNGFTVELLVGNSTLAEKLKHIYEIADDDFIRVDADVIPNKNLTEEAVRSLAGEYADAWWIQFLCFDWFQQDTSHGGVQFIKKEALPALRANIDSALTFERPESQMSRLKEFYEPRRFETQPVIMGLHNYRNDIDRVKGVKARRNQLDNYDFDLARRINEL